MFQFQMPQPDKFIDMDPRLDKIVARSYKVAWLVNALCAVPYAMEKVAGFLRKGPMAILNAWDAYFGRVVERYHPEIVGMKWTALKTTDDKVRIAVFGTPKVSPDWVKEMIKHGLPVDDGTADRTLQ